MWNSSGGACGGAVALSASVGGELPLVGGGCGGCRDEWCWPNSSTLAHP